MRLSGGQIADAMAAEALAEGNPAPPRRAIVDSSQASRGDLFFGLRGERRDGGEFAESALAAGAWGVVIGPGHAAALASSGLAGGAGAIADMAPPAWVFAAEDPQLALQRLATAWRRALGARVVGVTGSVGKTSVKDIARALLPGQVHANRENLNTEIGLPLTVLEAPEETETLVLEMAMRGAGQIAELAGIAEPDVAVITNVGPVHVEQMGSVAAIAAEKAAILDSLRPGGAAVAPAEAGELEPHLERVERLLRFGPGGDVAVVESRVAGGVTEATIATPLGEQRFELPFAEAHNLTNALAAIAAGVALGASPAEMAERAALGIGFSRFRGERLELRDGIVLVNDCYNANPVSMRAALDHLMTLEAPRRLAVLGRMGELGPDSSAYHREVGDHARAVGVDLVVGVGEEARDYDPDELVADPAEAAELLSAHLEAGDVVLVKGSRSAGLEAVAEALTEWEGAPGRGAEGESISDSFRPRRSRGGPA